MIPTRTAELADVEIQLDALFPPTATGKVVAAFGIHPFWNTVKNKYDHREWKERPFDYPADREKLIELINLAVQSGKSDAYLCTGLSYNGSREEGSLQAIYNLHCDWDGHPNDEDDCLDAVRALNGFAFSTGTPGHLHCFLPLVEPIITSGRYDQMAQAFHAKLPPGSEKYKWNDVLRIVGTDYLKDTVRPGGSGQPMRVHWKIQPSGQRWDLDKLAVTLGVGNAAQEPPGATNGSAPTSGTAQGVPFDLIDYPEVVAALTNPKLKADSVTVDRSATIAAVVGACASTNLELKHAHWAVMQRADLADKLAGMKSRDDVQHCWLMAIDSRQKARRDRGGSTAATFFGPNTDDGGNDTPPADNPFEADIAKKLDNLRIDREARRRLDEETRPQITLPPVKTLDALLDEPDSLTPFLIDRIAPAGGRVLLSAQYKAGKTTLVGNAIRSLADREPFLGRFDITETKNNIVAIDDELSENTIRRWIRDQNIVNTAAVADVIALRGKVGMFNILDDKCRSMWAKRLQDSGCDYLVLDCLRPILDALGLDENRDAGRFLVAFDALLDEAGIPDALLVQHMGHSNERARGDSRLQDWPDAIWRLVREDDTPESARYFSAYGRDVDVPEGRLDFHPATRRLTYAAGSRKDAKTEMAFLAVIDVLASHAQADADGEGMTSTAVQKALADDHPRANVRAALKQAVGRGLAKVTDGNRRAKLHTIANPCGECGRPMLIGQSERHRVCADWDRDLP